MPITFLVYTILTSINNINNIVHTYIYIGYTYMRIVHPYLLQYLYVYTYAYIYIYVLYVYM